MQCDMIFGDTGSTKTSRLGDAAEYFAEKTGLPVQLVSSDSGGWESIRSLVDQGVVIPYALTFERQYLIEDMNKMSMGWWPSDVNDPKSELKPPTWGKVSARFFEGATSWCQMMLTFHEAAVTMTAAGNMQATNVRVPEMPKDSYIQDGKFLRRFLGRSDYGGVQGRIKEFIRNSAMLPVPVIWTALETKGSDEMKKPVYGPDFVGQALTGVCGPWFGNLLHLDLLASAGEETVAGRKLSIIKAEPFLFTRPHIDPDDPTKVPYLAKPRADRRLWNKVPAVMAPDLKAFYLLLDKLQQEAKQLGSMLVQTQSNSKENTNQNVKS